MEFVMEEGVAVLERTPGALRAMLAGLPDQWTHRNEGGETWCPRDVIGHLVHGERADWIPRARTLLEAGESRPFTPFDRFAQFRESAGKTLPQLLDEFEALRRENLAILASLNLTAADLARAGTHPEFGRVTLGQLLATWVAHDLDHVVQIARTMAAQYRDAVGPWRAYLSVVR
jgi:DinB family protein